MSFILQNDLDKQYIVKLCKQIKLIKQSKIDWTIDDVLRFASLIKVEDSIKDIIVSWEIDGSKLFDIEYLSANLDCIITDRNYMPLYKLFYVVNAILQVIQGIQKEANEIENRKDDTKCNLFEFQQVDIAEEVIVGIKEQLQKLNNISIIQLGSTQLARILKNIQMCEQSAYVKKWSIDGFSLICIIGNQNDSQTLRNYFSNEDLKLFNRLSQIFLHLYYFQFTQLGQQTTMNDMNIQDFGIQFNDINFDQNRSFHSSKYGVSEAGDFKQDQEGQFTGQMRNSGYGMSQRGSVGVSEYPASVRGSVGVSEYPASVRGSVGISQAGSFRGSTRGSTRDSVAQSVYASSQIMEDQSLNVSNKKSTIALSSIEDDSILASLMSVALKLPFNLLNLEPLQRIKISSIPYPFNLNKSGNVFAKKQSSESTSTNNDNVSQKNESIYTLIEEDEQIREFKIFNLTGAKFGRNPENDFSYPDELSISGKHAQIVFKDESYYIRDLGSKTGTFVYISQKKPLILSDQQLVQLSYEVQFKVLIIKNDINEGIIKFQFKKPDNQPPYRAILKNNNTVRIGKADNSHIRLNNQSISSYHAQIKYEEGKFIMYDCNTRTGTWLRLSSKGIRSADRKLSKLDIIRISSKKTFLIQDMTEGIQFTNCCEANKWKYDNH